MITYRIIGQEQRDNETGNSYRLSAYVVAPTRGRARTLFVQYFDNQLEYKYEGIASCKVEKKGVRGPERVIESHYLRWEAAAEKLIADIKEEFPRDSAEWVDESMRDVWLAIGDSLDALAALLTVKDNATEEDGEK